MAQGDVTLFDYFLLNTAKSGVFDFGATPNTIKCGLIKSAANGGDDPDVGDVDPCWGAGGTVNLLTAEVTPGGNYTTGGAACANAAATLSGGAVEIDFDNPATWATNASNPTNARWAIIYDDTATNKNCIGFLDLGADFDMTASDLAITWGAPFATLDQG